MGSVDVASVRADHRIRNTPVSQRFNGVGIGIDDRYRPPALTDNQLSAVGVHQQVFRMIGQRNTGHHAVLTVEDRDRLG